MSIVQIVQATGYLVLEGRENLNSSALFASSPSYLVDEVLGVGPVLLPDGHRQRVFVFVHPRHHREQLAILGPDDEPVFEDAPVEADFFQRARLDLDRLLIFLRVKG